LRPSVPNAWIRRLDVLDPLLTLALDLASLSIRGEPALRRYPPNREHEMPAQWSSQRCSSGAPVTGAGSRRRSKWPPRRQ
jgi:hypothetical protein